MVFFLSHLDLMLLDDVDHGSLQSFKTVCDNVVTTPVGVKALSSFLIQKLNAIQSSPIRDNLNKYIVVAYSALAPKVATDDEIAVVNMIYLFDDNLIFFFYI